MSHQYQKILDQFPQIEQNKSLAPFNTMGIGGQADFFYKLTSIEDLPPLLQTAQKLKIPIFILGGGSNTIFADEGFRGLVIQMQARKIEILSEAEFNKIFPPDSQYRDGLNKAKNTHKSVPGHTNPKLLSQIPGSSITTIAQSSPGQQSAFIVAESGVLLSQVIQSALKNNLTGLEKLMGLPGTIGGAVRGNAGAFGTEIKDFVVGALIYSPAISATPPAHGIASFPPPPEHSPIKNQNGSDKPINAIKSVHVHTFSRDVLPNIKQPAGNPGSVSDKGHTGAQRVCFTTKRFADRQNNPERSEGPLIPHVHCALPLSTRNQIRYEPAEYFNFAYRSSIIKTTREIILKVYLKLPLATPQQAKIALAEAMEIVKNRISKQPKGKCSGSFFKNPADSNAASRPFDQAQPLKAGALLEQAGCKGLQIGQAQVSTNHANWIINLGGATQKDILALKDLMQQKVREKFGITLEPEVQLVGPVFSNPKMAPENFQL